MKKAETKVYTERLLNLRARLRGDVTQMADAALRKNRMDGAREISSMPIHMADLGSDNYDQEFTLSLLENEEQRLEEIGAALERIDQGRFGVCEGEECGKAIPKARLDALPFTRYCVECARKMQQSA